MTRLTRPVFVPSPELQAEPRVDPFTGYLRGGEASGDDWERIEAAVVALVCVEPTDRALDCWNPSQRKTWLDRAAGGGAG